MQRHPFYLGPASHWALRAHPPFALCSCMEGYEDLTQLKPWRLMNFTPTALQLCQIRRSTQTKRFRCLPCLVSPCGRKGTKVRTRVGVPLVPTMTISPRDHYKTTFRMIEHTESGPTSSKNTKALHSDSSPKSHSNTATRPITRCAGALIVTDSCVQLHGRAAGRPGTQWQQMCSFLPGVLLPVWLAGVDPDHGHNCILQ